MTALRPAWSEQFDADMLGVVRALAPDLLTREGALGARPGAGAGVDVAIVDSGIEVGHPRVGDLATSVALTVDPAAGGGVRIDETAGDAFGHGTACAGIVRAAAPACRLHSVRVLGERLTGKGAVFAAGLRHAVRSGCHVVNLSLSTSNEAHALALHELSDEAAHRGVVLVCAVSNTPSPSFPSTYSSVISVAAHAGTDPERWSWNPHPPVEVGAPGIDVDVAWVGGGSVVVTGNSFAAAHVSGIVARILGNHPGLTPFQVKTVLHALADNAVSDS
ncbi:MAG TPA: S8 family serine peptidase [Mycobacteriales bacterium]|nr:S8 family serine peptidase [Mycobacteriales bacterium]